MLRMKLGYCDPESEMHMDVHTFYSCFRSCVDTWSTLRSRLNELANNDIYLNSIAHSEFSEHDWTV
jgi:hypothetical protein